MTRLRISASGPLWRAFSFLLAAVAPLAAYAQGVPAYMSGSATPGALSKILTQGSIGQVGGLLGDAVTGKGANPFAITDSLGLGLCANTAATGASGGYNAFCIGHDADGNGLISLDSYGGYANKLIKFRQNGTTYELGNFTVPTASLLGGASGALQAVTVGTGLAFASNTLSATGMTPTAANATLPAALNNLTANSTGTTFYANAYGSCTWSAAGDVGPCINAAVTAALAQVEVSGGFRYGGATVVLPEGNYGLASTILQNNKTGVTIRGAGGVGSSGVCGTQLKWVGVFGGVMAQFGDDATQIVVGGGLEDLCLEGNSVAGVGLRLRGASKGYYRNVFIHDVTTDGMDINTSATDANGAADNVFDRFSISLQSVGAVNANGVKIGGGTATNNTYGNIWYGLHVQYQNGKGFICGNADSNIVYGGHLQTIGGGTGRSLQLLGGPGVIQNCRSNFFYARHGFGNNVAGTAPVAETDTQPSADNYIFQNTESGALVPVINGSATLTYDTNKGVHYSNASGATSFTQGGLVYKATPGTTRGVLDVDTANGSNFAVGGVFGPTLPVYLHYNNPIVAFNEYWNGAGWRYGRGSTAHHAGRLAFDTTTGTLTWRATQTTGAADAALVGDTAIATLSNIGDFAPIGHVTLLNAKRYNALDSGGTFRSLLQLDGSNRTILDGGAGGLLLRDNNTAATIGSSDGAGNLTVNNQLKSSYNGAAVRPASIATAGFALTNNYDAAGEVNYWNVVDGGGGHCFIQKIGASTEQSLGCLYGNASFSQYDLYSSTAAFAVGVTGTEGFSGTTTNTPYKLYVNNAVAATLDTSRLLEYGDANQKVSTATLSKTSDTTLATVTGLSIALTAGKTYKCSGYLSGTSGAAGGVKVALVASGGLTATSARFNGFTWNGTTAVSNTTVTALGSNIAASNAIYTDIYIEGAIVVNVAGTINVQAAQNTSDGTATTVLLNSTFGCTRVN